MIAVISMSGHVWSQQVPLWSIIIRTIHLIGLTLWLGSLVYLICYAIKVKINQLTSVRRMLLKLISLLCLCSFLQDFNGY